MKKYRVVAIDALNKTEEELFLGSEAEAILFCRKHDNMIDSKGRFIDLRETDIEMEQPKRFRFFTFRIGFKIATEVIAELLYINDGVVKKAIDSLTDEEKSLVQLEEFKPGFFATNPLFIAIKGEEMVGGKLPFDVRIAIGLYFHEVELMAVKVASNPAKHGIVKSVSMQEELDKLEKMRATYGSEFG